MGQVQTHETSTSLVRTDLGEVDAGTDVALEVKVSCPSACDLRGGVVKIIAHDAAVLKQVELTGSDETTSQTEEFVVRSPMEPGEYTWRAVFPAQEKEGVVHAQSSAPFSFVVKPHATSIAVWEVASPVVLGTDFSLKAGVKCSLGCSLADSRIEVYDHEGAKVATGTFGDVPYSDAVDLYWTEMELTSPTTEGTYTWEVRVPTPHSQLPHEGTSFKFGFSVTKQPKHAVTIEAVDQDTKAPVVNAHVMLRPYSGHTDSRGVVKLRAAEGEYRLYITKGEYETFQTTVDVAGDATIRAELIPALYEEDYRGNLWKVDRRKLRPAGHGAQEGHSAP